MTRIKHVLCILLTWVVLLQPLLMVSRATEEILPGETEASIPSETEITQTFPDEQPAESTPTEAAEAEATETT